MNKTITLVCVDTIHPEKSIVVLNHMLDIFGHRLSGAKLFTNKDYNTNRIEVINIQELENIEDYNEFMIMSLVDYIDTDYVLVVQSDGYIINPNVWTEDFLKYDYIGAPWPIHIAQTQHRVGNGGFSLRSRRFMEYVKKIESLRKYFYIGRKNMAEDVYICSNFNENLKYYGMSFAPIEVAAKFSFEHEVPERTISIEQCFGFHDFKAHPELKEKYKL